MPSSVPQAIPAQGASGRDRLVAARANHPAGARRVRDGSFIVLGRVFDDKVLIQDPRVGRPQLCRGPSWRRAGPADLGREFNVGWSRHSSFSWLRWSRRCSSSGDRQGAGASRVDHTRRAGVRADHVSVFEALIGALRTYVFTHATNRIDVELGARLFRHLMALPIAPPCRVTIPPPAS
jgi:ATP-binding cassette, subfamily B, bacterial HlyB/CyaB